jgi:hypothetical protein
MELYVIIESGEYNIEAYMEATLLKENMFWKPYKVGHGSNVIIGSFLQE